MGFDCCSRRECGDEIGRTVGFLQVIAEENRLKTLCVLKRGEMCVCEIWKLLDLPQNLVSHHLKVLKDFGLVDSRKDGTKVIYSLNAKTLKRLAGGLNRLI